MCIDSYADISIHTPTRGTTAGTGTATNLAEFQSTFPREERPYYTIVRIQVLQFQSTLPREERRNSTGNQIDSYEKMINTPMTSIDSPFPNTARDYYDYMIIDNPPDIAFNVIAALKITDEVIVPVKIDEWALEGLDIIADQIKQARQINRKIKMLGVLATMYRNNDANNAGLEWLAEKSPVKLLGKIRYTDKAAESTFLSKPVYEYSPRCGAAQDYKKLVTEYLESTKEREA